MPKYPNFAFEFIFRGIDTYSEKIYSTTEQLTARIQNLIDNEFTSYLNNDKLCTVINELYKVMPNTTCQYLYSRLYGKFDTIKDVYSQTDKKTKQLFTRLLMRSNNKAKYSNLAQIFGFIASQYGYDRSKYKETIRNGSRLLYRIFNEDKIDISGITYDISFTDKLNLLIGGVLFTMRNDRAHGDGISSFKSSLASLKTYAHNYYCFLCCYIFLTLIMEEFSESNEEKLTANFKDNITRFSEIFGNKILKQ